MKKNLTGVRKETSKQAGRQARKQQELVNCTYVQYILTKSADSKQWVRERWTSKWIYMLGHHNLRAEYQHIHSLARSPLTGYRCLCSPQTDTHAHGQKKEGKRVKKQLWKGRNHHHHRCNNSLGRACTHNFCVSVRKMFGTARSRTLHVSYILLIMLYMRTCVSTRQNIQN